ncbi:MAG: hypothetical protein ACE5JK_08040, partial [Candidatus Omnitrophota bacterium]
ENALAPSAENKILAAVERIKERGETATGKEIAEEAGVHIGTVARLKDESDEVRKAVDSVSLSAKQKILAAVKRIKERGETATDKEIAEEAGVHPVTLAHLKADNNAVRKAVESISMPPAKQKILAVVKRIKESGEKATRAEIAEEAGVALHTLVQLKKFDPALRKAIDEVLPRSVRTIQNVEQESIPVSYRKTLQSMRILMGLFCSNIDQHVLDFRGLDWYDLERGLYARREVLDDIVVLLEEITVSDKSLTWGARKSIRGIWKKVMEIYEALNETVGSFANELSRKKRNTFIDILAKLRRVKDLCATILGEETPPPGSPATLLKYMHEHGIDVNNPRRVVQMANKRRGNDSFSMVQKEIRVLREAGLVERIKKKKGKKVYVYHYLPGWVMKLGPEEIIDGIPELEEANPIKKVKEIRSKAILMKEKANADAESPVQSEPYAVSVKVKVHPTGINNRVVDVLSYVYQEIQRQLPDSRITFRWSDKGESIEETIGELAFKRLYESGYKGEIKITVTGFGFYREDSLRRTISILATIMSAKRFLFGINPDRTMDLIDFYADEKEKAFTSFTPIGEVREILFKEVRTRLEELTIISLPGEAEENLEIMIEDESDDEQALERAKEKLTKKKSKKKKKKKKKAKRTSMKKRKRRKK